MKTKDLWGISFLILRIDLNNNFHIIYIFNLYRYNQLVEAGKEDNEEDVDKVKSIMFIGALKRLFQWIYYSFT